ncbi:MAG: flap endonuclease [Proteobacteria bacterium]|nr:MAG: flap endonuclease [Pseudomonadota bacterium]
MTHLLDKAIDQQVWLIDSSIYIFRAWFARQPTQLDNAGQAIHAVKGFLQWLYSFLYSQTPHYLGFAFDTSLQSSVRKTLYPAYKANRPPAPDELKYQFQLCREFVEALGLVQTSSLHYEADDIIGTWAQHYQQQNKQIIIVSGDKDLTQLIRERDVWWDYGRRSALNAGGIKSSLGVWPEQIVDQLAIAGDKVDNIPGVPGVGMSTAAKLLRRFGTLDKMLEHIETIGSMQLHGAKRLQKLIEQHQDTIHLARQLTKIHRAVPAIPLALHRHTKKPEQLKNLCEQLGLNEQQYNNWLKL